MVAIVSLLMVLVLSLLVTKIAAIALYGKVADIARLDRRKKGPGGNIEHAEAVARRKVEAKRE